jgi:hypothetical protein
MPFPFTTVLLVAAVCAAILGATTFVVGILVAALIIEIGLFLAAGFGD